MAPEGAADEDSASSTSTENADEPEVGGSSMAEQTDANDDGARPGAPPPKNASSAPSGAKDPLRPRRKKARRACFACQRAHLTCGDERPCQRCIKRGLQDSCHDGMRKKAKYLHDAPNEALMPGIVNPPFHLPMGEIRHGHAPPLSANLPSPDGPPSAAPFFPSSAQPVSAAVYGVYPQAGAPGQMPPPLQDYGGQQQPPISPALHSAAGQGLGGPLPQASPVNAVPPQRSFGGPIFDASDPAFFSFDLASLNFGNHYGALEFGMLGHMSSGANEISPPEHGASLAQGAPGFVSSSGGSSGYVQSPGSAGFPFGQDAVMDDWQGNGAPRRGSVGDAYRNGGASARRRNAGLAHGYTIGTGGSSLASPSPASSPQELGRSFDGGMGDPRFYQQAFVGGQPLNPAQPQQSPQQAAVQLEPQARPPKRARDPSSIYDTVKSPYPYTQGFHRLTAFLQRRFSAQMTLRIAKALASIRPSFISCTKSLNRDDLIFMEKCFQRTLWEYEGLINACSTPTIVCRRTGEVAAVSKEFSILTGWRRDVLLGKEANLNANSVLAPSKSGTGASSRGGFSTPRVPEGASGEEADGVRPQPVFLAELLDDDGVIQFYEDFAKLAFGDSRGSVTGRCRLIKYKTKGDLQEAEARSLVEPDEPDAALARRSRGRPAPAGGIAGEASIHGLESQDGKVDCSYCWTVKRDVFDIPMLIVMNVSFLSEAPRKVLTAQFLPCI
ncbi:MAG: Transcriptional regulator of nonfermentable carbon utilization [Thelocarpon impressellum]|nr:MAG: Transcriptional regulator of nonfermentable carbon utilization [Thelocarpon impressellum]